LFITHIAARRQVAGELGDSLNRRGGVDAFVAHDAIKPTVAWQDEIEDALSHMRCVCGDPQRGLQYEQMV
jgi:hypothetical protein